MEYSFFIMIFSLLVILYYNYQYKEPFSKQKLNENQYQYCLDIHKTPYYGIVSNIIPSSPPRQGLFTELRNKPFDYTKYKQVPICKDNYKTNMNILDNEKIIDPLYPYSNSKDDSLILYNDPYIEKNFLDYFQKVRLPDIIGRKF